MDGQRDVTFETLLAAERGRLVRLCAVLAGDRAAVEYLEQIQCPMLLVFGERDTLVDIQENIDVYTAALEKAGNSDVTIQVFPEADHCLFVSETGGLKEMRRMWAAPVKTYAPAYLNTLAAWVQDRFV